MADGYLNFETEVNTAGFNKGVKGLTSSFKKLAGAAAGFFAFRQFVRMGKEAVQFASDLQEVQNVVDTAFGSMAYKCEEFADIATEQFGMSKLSAKQTASTYMAMAKSMGLSMENASDMAIETAKLTGDVASFYNISQDLASTKLKSIFTGETETLKDLGVVMTEDNLKAYALSQGITKSYSAMTQGEKVSLRFGYVMSSLADAQGDFARTSDSWANQTRVLSERWKELLGIIGNGLITVLTPVVKMLNTLVATLINVGNAISKSLGSLFGKTTETTMSLAESAGSAAAAEGDFADSTKEAAKAAEGSLASFDELNILQSGERDSAATAGNAVAVELPATIETTEVETEVGSFTERIESLLIPLKEIDFTNLQTTLTNLKAAFEPFKEKIGAGLEWLYFNVLLPLATWTIENVLPLFLQILTNVLNILGSVITALQPAFLWLWDNFLQPIAVWTGGMIVTVLELLVAALKKVSDWCSEHQTTITVITGIVTGFFAAWKVVELMAFIQQAGGVAAVFGKIKSAIELATVAKIKDLAATVQQKVMYAGEFLKSIADVIAMKAKEVAAFATVTAAKAKDLAATIQLKAMYVGDLIKGVLDVIAAKAREVAAWVAATAAKLADQIATAAHTVVIIAHTVATTAATVATTLFGAAMSILTAPITLVIAAIAALIGIVVLLVKNWDKVKAAATAVWDTIKEVWGKAADWIKEKVIEPIKQVFNDGINFLVGLAESYANIWVKAANVIVDALNSISVEVPDWVPLIGGKTFGFNLPSVPEVSLPKLASGAVIPPHSEFAAILGDQRRGTNIEAPLDTIVQAFRMALDERGSGENNYTIRATGSLAQLIKLLRLEIRKEDVRAGKNLIKGGVY